MIEAFEPREQMENVRQSEVTVAAGLIWRSKAGFEAFKGGSDNVSGSEAVETDIWAMVVDSKPRMQAKVIRTLNCENSGGRGGFRCRCVRMQPLSAGDRPANVISDTCGC